MNQRLFTVMAFGSLFTLLVILMPATSHATTVTMPNAFRFQQETATSSPALAQTPVVTPRPLNVLETDISLPQKYENTETGLSFRLPAEWVVAERFFPLVYVANTENSMNAITVRPGDLFITIDIEEREEWENRVDTSNGITAYETALYYQEEAELAAGDGPTLEQPATPLADFTLDAALLSGEYRERQWLYVMLIPNDTHVIRIQAAAVVGELDDFAAEVFAFANTLRYDGREIEILRLIEERQEPVLVKDDDLSFSFEHAWWLSTEIVDTQAVVLRSNPAAENPWPETTLGVALPREVPFDPEFEALLRFVDYADLSINERDLLVSSLTLARQRLFNDYPDATITDELERNEGAAGSWARVYAETADGLQVARWVLVPAGLEQVVFADARSLSFFDSFQAQLAGILRDDLMLDLFVYSGPFPPGG